MKHQYFGDVNDFRKYGLLRALRKASNLRLAVWWMLTPDDQRTDGRFITYLSDPRRWSKYDGALFDGLVDAVPSGRNLRHVGEKDLLPGSVLVDGLVPDNRVQRAEYFDEVQRSIGDAELVFFDPDNGIEVPSCPPGGKGSSKYVTWNELLATFRTGKSLLVYQHFPRRKRGIFIGEITTQLQSRLSAPLVVCFQTANVAFLLVCQAAHEAALRKAATAIGASWRGQIELTIRN